MTESDAPRGLAELREAATALHYRQGEGWQGLDRCQEALDDLLYSEGGDGVGALEVVEASPTRVTLVGLLFWVDPSPNWGVLVEATFTFDRASRAISEVVVRAGEDVSDDPYPPGHWDEWSPRHLAKRVANRPESDERWEVVIRAPSS